MSHTALLEYMRNSGQRGAQFYEAFFLSLLSHHQKQQGKGLQQHAVVATSQKDTRYEADAIAQEGIGDIPGPVVVELTITRNISQQKLDADIARLDTITRVGNFKSALLVLAGVELNATKDKLKARALPSGAQLYVWDKTDVDALVNKYPEEAARIAANIDAIRLDNIVSKSSNATSDTWRQERAEYLKDLHRAYTDNELALFLGAGVSVDAGVPTWDTLLNGMLANLIRRKDSGLGVTDGEVQELVSRFRAVDNPSPLMAARYLRRGLADTFVSDVTAFLYQTIAHNEPQRRDELPGRVRSNTLNALARLCVPRRSGPGIRAVVTYNFDDLFEKALTDAAVSHRAIFREGVFEGKDELAIYHVHGFLPEDGEKYPDNGKGIEELVFSEEGYHRLFGDPYSWANLVQLNLLRDASCLMLGLSLTDPNLRRLLEVSAHRNENYYHHAILRRISPDAFTKNRDGTPAISARPAVVERFLAVHHQIQDELFAELGVKIIWIEQYAEIPQILSSIVAGGG